MFCPSWEMVKFAMVEAFKFSLNMIFLHLGYLQLKNLTDAKLPQRRPLGSLPCSNNLDSNNETVG